ncbi:efflux transporter outer membrane subunit [Microvirga flavescens]|uniref:efflux transporter outer membrane subunit n=1 Tax=Microvirga flavescens TaxID=2249811 RepID=UPI000DD88D6A|nr:efflux transporter outer membrane subunit [Microvirga flavescens]
MTFVRFLRAVGLVALTATASACALDPDVPSLSAQIPERFANARGAGGWPSDGWWRLLGSAELNRAMESARSGNLDVSAAMSRIEQANAQIKVASQGLIPSLSASADVAQSFQGSRSGTAGRGLTHSGSASLGASYELDLWGKNLSVRRAAEANAAASEFDLATIVITTDASVASTYFQILALKRRLVIAHENIASARTILDAVKARVKFGTASNLDVAQQESLLDNLLVNVPGLELQVQQSIYALAILLGQTPESLKITGSNPDAIRIPPIRPGLPSELIERRPDVAFAEAQLAAARFNIQAAKAKLLPSIQLTGAGGFQSAAFRTLINPSSQFYQMAAGLTQPILDAYSLQGQVEVDQGRFRELLANYQKTVLVALQEVESALVAYHKTAEQEVLQRKAVESSQRAYDISVEQLRAGIIDRTTLLNAEQTLFSAQNNLVQVRLSRLQSVIDLYRALGGGWERGPALDVARVP